MKTSRNVYAALLLVADGHAVRVSPRLMTALQHDMRLWVALGMGAGGRYMLTARGYEVADAYRMGLAR